MEIPYLIDDQLKQHYNNLNHTWQLVTKSTPPFDFVLARVE